MIRVMHLITTLSTGGAEMSLARLAPAMDSSRFESRVVCLSEPGAAAGLLEGRGVPVTDLGMRRGVPGPAGALRFARALAGFRPRVLMTWLYHADLMGALSAPLVPGLRLAWNLRCSDMDLSRYSRLTRLVRASCAKLSFLPDAVVANSHAGLARHRDYGYRPRRFLVIENGVDLTRFRPDPDARAAARKAWGIAPEAELVGFAGRWDPMKNLPLFFAAARRLRESRPEARFVFAGPGMDAENAELAGLAQREGLAGSCLFLGVISDMPGFYNGLSALCLSSVSEGFPNVVAEAMACGVPCAVTEAGDAARIVGDTGRAAHVDDPAALAGALKEVLEQGGKGGRACRERIEEHFSLARAVGSYEKLFSDLADNAII